MMNKILLLHGPNLNLLGRRESEHYGDFSLTHIENIVTETALRFNYRVTSFQSNHEGYIIDKIQLESPYISGIIINPGAHTHYSFAIYDALRDAKLPTVEVHLSDISQREVWRQKSIISSACIKTIAGKKEKGYIEAVEYLVEALKK
jgi:3-dehydroquinate dehydratase-2